MSIVSFFKRRWHLFILFFIWLYSTILQFIWLTLDKMPPWGDAISFVLRGMHLFQQQNLHGWEGLIKSLFHFEASHPSPPVIEITYFLYYKIFGIASEMEVMVNSLFLVVGIIGIYGTARYLFDKNTGLLSALIFASLPGVLAYSKLGYKEFHIMCFLALTVYFLLRSDSFKNRRFSFFFALSSAVMLSIKLESIIFIIFPAFVIGVKPFLDREFFRSRYRIINIVLILVIGFFVFSNWYLINLSNFTQFLIERIGDKGSTNNIYFSTKDLGFYIYHLSDRLLTKFQIVFFTAISIYILIRTLLSERKTPALKRNIFLLACFIFPFLVFTFLCEKDAPHILSLLIFVSLIMAGGCSVIKNKIIKHIAIFIVVLHCINTQLISLSAYNADMRSIPFLVRLSPADNILYKLRGKVKHLYGVESRINDKNWEDAARMILAFIRDDYKAISGQYPDSSEKKPTVFLLVNADPLRLFQLEYYNLKMWSPLSLIWIYSDNVNVFFTENLLNKDSVCETNYILIEEPSLFQHTEEEDRGIKEAIDFIKAEPERFRENYELIREFILPRDSKALIYRSLGKEK